MAVTARPQMAVNTSCVSPEGSARRGHLSRACGACVQAAHGTAGEKFSPGSEVPTEHTESSALSREEQDSKEIAQNLRVSNRCSNRTAPMDTRTRCAARASVVNARSVACGAVAQHGMAWHGMALHTAWHGAAWHGVKRRSLGAAQLGDWRAESDRDCRGYCKSL